MHPHLPAIPIQSLKDHHIPVLAFLSWHLSHFASASHQSVPASGLHRLISPCIQSSGSILLSSSRKDLLLSSWKGQSSGSFIAIPIALPSSSSMVPVHPPGHSPDFFADCITYVLPRSVGVVTNSGKSTTCGFTFKSQQDFSPHFRPFLGSRRIPLPIPSALLRFSPVPSIPGWLLRFPADDDHFRIFLTCKAGLRPSRLPSGQKYPILPLVIPFFTPPPRPPLSIHPIFCHSSDFEQFSKSNPVIFCDNRLFLF